MQTSLASNPNSWLLISADGFAMQQAGRDPALLVKELLQNSLDSSPSRIEFQVEYEHATKTVLVTCDDLGEGVPDLELMRTVFHTSKTDSHFKRGRMGRGFKEMLVIANSARVESKNQIIEFYRDKKGSPFVKTTHGTRSLGTKVQMVMPWTPSQAEDIVQYFERILVPDTVQLTVNGNLIAPRKPKYTTKAALPTECFDGNRWIKPVRKTLVNLVPVINNETPFVYEMGIPVCPLEWDQPYNLDVGQRVPMNPNRDAVASGFLTKLHRAALPVLVDEMDSTGALADWVGSAAAGSIEPVQIAIVDKAFGSNAVRSVPKFGKHSFDDDAQETLDATIVNVRHLPSGFKSLALRHIKTSREVVKAHQKELASQQSIDAEATLEIDQDAILRAHIDAVGGMPRVKRVCEFAKWFCDAILEQLQEPNQCKVKFGVLKGADATWSDQGAILTLSIAYAPIWMNPVSRSGLQLLIHEVAHEKSAHHGLSYTQTMEDVAGIAAELMLRQYSFIIGTFRDLMT
jgi:hypothetical protein